MKKNKFSKALRHLKSTELDEKIKSLNESPTNSMGGVYALNQPGHRLSRELDPAKVFYPDVDGNFPSGIPGTPGEPNYVRPAGYWDEGPGTTAANPYDTLYTANWSYSVQEDNARNTETLIDPDTGYVLSELPPNSRSFILGPLVDLYFHNHSNDNRTYVGYVQKDTREFVLLGYVNGRWGNDNDGNLIHQDGISSGRIWNGESSQFVATNSNFTFDMLQWFHNKLKAGLSVKNASFFNSGGVPIISGGGGEGQPTGSVQGNAAGAGSGDASDGNDANVGSGTGGNPDIGTPQNSPNHGGPGEAILWGLISSLVGKLGPLGLAVNSVGDILKLVDQLPALDYSKDIAMSILTGKPIVHDQSDIPQNQIDALINNISSNMIGNSIPVTNQEIPYADDNIKTNLSGKVSPNVGPNKVPNTTGPMSFNDPGPAGLLNPLHAAGQAQAQVVIPDDGSEPYFKYTDHAYYNPNSTDPGEVPDPIKSVLANLIQSLGGGLDGYPEQIKGDSIKTFEVPVSELPSNLQTAIQKELDYQNIVKTQKDNQTQSDIKYTDDIEKLGQPETNNTPSNDTYTDDPVKFFSNPQSEPQSPPLSSYQSKQEVVKSKTYQDKLKGTWADPTFRAQEVAAQRAYYLSTSAGQKYPDAPPAAGGVGDPKWMDQQAEKARARARGEVVNYISKPVANVQDNYRAQLEKNIEDSLKQLEIDNEELKGEKLRRNLALAADIGLDVLTVITLLTPIPGDEAAALSAQAAKAGIKTGAKTASQKTTIDAFRIKLTSPDTLAKAQQAINKAGPGFADDVAIQLTANGKTGIFKAKDILRSKGFKVESVNVNLTESRKRILREIKQPSGKLLTEGWESPKHTNIEKDMRKRFFDPKDIAPEYPKEPPAPMVGGYSSKSKLAPKKVNDKGLVIKITKKDLLRNHRLTKDEVQDMMDTINKINKFLAANPGELIHAQIRYPKDDPRLAELNWKMDQQLAASDKYIEKQFPENQRLFDKITQATKKTVALTDPKTFKDSKPVLTYGKVFGNDLKSKKVKESKLREKSASRFFKKEKKVDTSRTRWIKG